jgi:hypothetical protein
VDCQHQIIKPALTTQEKFPEAISDIFIMQAGDMRTLLIAITPSFYLTTHTHGIRHGILPT